MSYNGDPDVAIAMKEWRKNRKKWGKAREAQSLEGNTAFLCTKTIERRFGILRRDVINAIKSGLLKAFRGPANRWLVHPDDFETYRRNHA